MGWNGHHLFEELLKSNCVVRDRPARTGGGYMAAASNRARKSHHGHPGAGVGALYSFSISWVPTVCLVRVLGAGPSPEGGAEWTTTGVQDRLVMGPEEKIPLAWVDQGKAKMPPDSGRDVQNPIQQGGAVGLKVQYGQGPRVQRNGMG